MGTGTLVETKPFYKTSEFWLMVAGQAVIILQYVNVWTLFHGRWSFLAPVIQSALAYAYIQSRGHAKSGVPYAAEDTNIAEFTTPGTNLDSTTPVSEIPTE